MTLTKNLFSEIKASLSTKKDDSPYKEIMKFEPGKTYAVRLVPNIADPRSSIYHYWHHSWNSLSTGQFVTTLCPSTYNESCPIDNYVIKTYRTGSTEEKEKMKPITRKEAWMVNAYIITDPSNPENEGKVKIIRYGKELAKIITSAIEGDDAQEFGAERIFDVANGSTLRIKCESRAGNAGNARNFVTYASSKFISPTRLEGVNEDKIEALHNGVFDLTKMLKTKTQSELQRMLDQHFFCIQDTDTEEDVEDFTTPVVRSSSLEAKSDKVQQSNNNLDKIFEGVETATSSTSSTDDVDDTDAKLKELLAGL